MRTYEFYKTLNKPRWAPPRWLFGPVWTFLYALIVISYGYVGYLFALNFVGFRSWVGIGPGAVSGASGIPSIALLPFILNLIFNLAFVPIQFGLKHLRLASLDVLLTLITLIWAMFAIYPYAPWVVWINLPQLAWVCFATILQFTVTSMNR
jgi:tryptophan-rich sensory protein